MKYSEGIKHKFPGYSLDSGQLVVNEESNPQIDIDFEEFKNLMLASAPKFGNDLKILSPFSINESQ